MARHVQFIIFGLLCSVTALWGAEPAAKSVLTYSPTGLPTSIDLNRPKQFMTIADCVQNALRQNLDISIQRLTPQIGAADVQAAEGIFDVNWTSVFSESENQKPGGFQSLSGSIINQAGSDQRIYNYQETLGGLTPLGTKYSFGLNGSRVQSSTFGSGMGPSWSSSLGFNLTQPLAKGFGWDVNTAQIRIARKTQDISYQQFVAQVMTTVASVKQSYYDLIYSIENVKVKEESLALANRFLDESRKRMEVGTMARLDIVQAEARVAQADADLIDARRVLEEAQYSFKQLISRDVLSMRESMIVPVDRPSVVPMPIDALDSIRQGLDNRPDYLQGKLQLELSHIQLKYYRNSLLPQVDLGASYGYNALNQGDSQRDFSNLNRNMDSIGRGDFPQWSAGLTITVPLGNNTSRGNYRHWKLTAEQSLLGLKKTEQNIIVTVETAAIEAQAKAKLIVASQATTRLQEESLRAEEEKLKAGTSTTFVVLSLQRDLANARVQELQAVADYNKAVVNLSLQEGTILKRSGVSVELEKK